MKVWNNKKNVIESHLFGFRFAFYFYWTFQSEWNGNSTTSNLLGHRNTWMRWSDSTFFNVFFLDSIVLICLALALSSSPFVCDNEIRHVFIWTKNSWTFSSVSASSFRSLSFYFIPSSDVALEMFLWSDASSRIWSCRILVDRT